MLAKSNLPSGGGNALEKTYQAEVCNICGSTQFRRIHYFAEFNQCREPVKDVAIVQCRQCKVRRRQPAIIDDFEFDYHLQYFNEQGQSDLALHPNHLALFVDLMTARLRQLKAQHVNFLDVGCSTGRALKLAAAMGFEVTGLDYSKWAADFCAKQGFRIRQGSLLGQWSESEVFDIIHCSHTVEHLPDPMAYLKEMHRLLKRGGHLMLACPNYASLPRWMKGKKWPVWCLDSHLWQFTASQMAGLLKATGFTVLSVKTVHGYTPDSAAKKRLLDWAALCGYGDAMNIIATR